MIKEKLRKIFEATNKGGFLYLVHCLMVLTNIFNEKWGFIIATFQRKCPTLAVDGERHVQAQKMYPCHSWNDTLGEKKKWEDVFGSGRSGFTEKEHSQPWLWRLKSSKTLPNVQMSAVYTSFYSSLYSLILKNNI